MFVCKNQMGQRHVKSLYVNDPESQRQLNMVRAYNNASLLNSFIIYLHVSRSYTRSSGGQRVVQVKEQTQQRSITTRLHIHLQIRNISSYKLSTYNDDSNNVTHIYSAIGIQKNKRCNIIYFCKVFSRANTL